MDNVSIGWLKPFIDGKLLLKVKRNDDYEPTFKELKDGVYVNYFKNSTDPRMVSSGLLIEGSFQPYEKVPLESVKLYYIKLESANIDEKEYEVKSSAFELPIFGSVDFSLIAKSYDGVEEFIETKTSKASFSLKIKKDVTWVKNELGKRELIFEPNDTGELRETVITAWYYFKQQKAKTTFTVKQQPNALSGWIKDNEETVSLTLTVDPEIISKEGGVSIIKTIRNYHVNYHKEDRNGAVVETTYDEQTKDVTSLCNYTLSNTIGFKRIGNNLKVSPQIVDAPSRSTFLTSEYDGVVTTLKITQENGSKSKKVYDFYFNENNEKTLDLTLENASEKIIVIPFTSKHIQYIGEEIESVENALNLEISEHSSWVECEIDEVNMKLKLHISPNTSKETPRDCVVKIINSLSLDEITLNLVQPIDEEKGINYTIDVPNELYFEHDNMDSDTVTVTVYKEHVYYSNTIIKEVGIDDGFTLNVTGNTDNSQVIKVGKIVATDVNGVYLYKPQNIGGSSIVKTNLRSVFFITDNNASIVSKKMVCNITINKQIMTTYIYDFKTIDNKYDTEIIWNADELTATKDIDLISTKTTLLNGIESGASIQDYKYLSSDNDYSYFNVIKNGNKLSITPHFSTIASDVRKQYSLVQNDSNKTINVNFVLFSKIETQDVNVKVVLNRSNGGDAWSNSSSKLNIINKTSNNIQIFNLNSGWVSPNNNIISDVMLNTIVSLEKGREYILKIENILISSEDNSLIENDYNIEENAIITNDVNEIILNINL